MRKSIVLSLALLLLAILGAGAIQFYVMTR